MKAHISADAASGLVHSVTGTAANVSDISQTHELLHGEEQVVHADAGYLGVEKRPEIIAGRSNVEWRVAARRGKIKAMPQSWVEDLKLGYEKLKARVRARVEHPFHIVKNLFGHRKVRYRGIKKNTAQIEVLFALANLVIAKKNLLKATRILHEASKTKHTEPLQNHRPPHQTPIHDLSGEIAGLIASPLR